MYYPFICNSQYQPNFQKMKIIKSPALFCSLLIAVLAGLLFAGCSNNDEPTPPSKSRSMLKCVVRPSDQLAKVTSFRLDIHNRIIDFDMEGIGRTMFSESSDFQDIVNAFHDMDFSNERDSLMNAYRPFSVPVDSIAVHPYRNTDDSLQDEFDIIFISYAPYLRNNYTWPEGTSGPIQRMSLREFNSRPRELVHYQFTIVPSSKIAEEAYQPFISESLRYLFTITVKFANGERFYNSVQFYKDEDGNVLIIG